MKKLLLSISISLVYLCLHFVTQGLAATAQYTYDNLNRLVQVQYDDGTTIQYAYDAVGNPLLQQVTAFSQMMSLPSSDPFAPTG